MAVERARMAFADARRLERSGALVVTDGGQVALRVSPVLEAALEEGEEDLGPLYVDRTGMARRFLGALLAGVPAGRVSCELASGSLVVRGYLEGWVRLSLRPGDFDPDAAWELVLAANETAIEAVA